MKRIFFLIVSLGFAAVSLTAQGSNNVDQNLQTEANQIVNQLSLDKSKEKLVYNVLYHVKTRLEDLALGTPNYDKLLSYIDEERSEMMKVIMPTTTYSTYKKMYDSPENEKLEKLKKLNTEYVNTGNQDKQAEVMMQKDKILTEQP